ncbi:MAG: PPK2 family polyphosphate kinase [Lysobacterales bacterium]
MSSANEPSHLEAVIERIDSPWLVPYDGSLDTAPTTFSPPDTNKDCKHHLKKARKAIRPYQHKLYAGKQYSILLIFQALDAAGKDGAIREVFEGLDPAGVNISSFKKPTLQELSHDFLWRTVRTLPARGEIGVFNRSYYEEVLTVRVHPEYLGAQYAGNPPHAQTLWPCRYRAIREHEFHLATANTLVLKFWLNVSPAIQARRFIERLDTPQKRWKFSREDIRESTFRPQYDEALLHMLNETSRPWAPWFCIPADERWYLRWQIADILHQAMSALPLHYREAEEIPTEESREIRALLTSRMKGD